MKKVTMDREVRLLDDCFKVDEAYFSHELFSGGMSPRVRRLSFERGDSVAAILFNRDTQHVVLIEQFRYPAYKKGPGWLIEAVAGIVQADETPEAALRREVLEETGYRIERLSLICRFYLSPGGSSERITLYLAEVSDSSKVGPGGGVSEEGEDIRIVEFSLKALREELAARRIQDAKSLVGCMWLLSRQSPGGEALSLATLTDE